MRRVPTSNGESLAHDVADGTQILAILVCTKKSFICDSQSLIHSLNRSLNSTMKNATATTTVNYYVLLMLAIAEESVNRSTEQAFRIESGMQLQLLNLAPVLKEY